MVSPKVINVVIGYTPYHYMFAAGFIPRLEGETYSLFSAKHKSTKIETGELGIPYRGNDLIGSLCLAASVIRFSVFFWLAVLRKIKVKVYLPHANHFIGNYIYFSKYVSEVFIYEDGILNYYDAPLGKNEINSSKKLLSYLICMPYRKYEGHITGLDAREASGAYLSRPEYAVKKKKIRTLNKVPIVEEEIAIENNVILFLDQDVAGKIAPSERKYIKEFVCNLISNGRFAAYYKPHHGYNEFHEWNSCMVPLEEKLHTAPAEKIVQILRPGLVLSYCSSALINIKQKYPNITCVALASDAFQVTRDGRGTTLSELFLETGVAVFSRDNKAIVDEYCKCIECPS